MRTLLARFVLRCMRWTTVVQEPVPDRCVMIAGPHTTNWDFVVMVSMARVKGISMSSCQPQEIDKLRSVGNEVPCGGLRCPGR